MRRRLIISLALLSVGLGSILLLPKSFGLQPAAVFDAFPTSVGEWIGRYREPGKKEKEMLDKGTGFRKRLYVRESRDHLLQYETIDATMVLSGDDMNNSIHRPERCLLAQGYEDITPSMISIAVGDKSFNVKRLSFVKRMPDGKVLPAIMYYWFVGADHLTASHYERTIYDIKHRLLEGTNQRWAYISLQSQFGPGWSDEGESGLAPTTEEETDAFMQDFIQRTFFQIHKTEDIKGWKGAAKAAQVATAR